MPVKHALLALLAQRDLTGYELKLRFERALGEFWQLNSGQVYSTLERLRVGGLVLRRDEGAAIARARYTLLPRGRRQLERWLESPLPRLRPVRDPLFVKLVFSSPERAAELLDCLGAEVRRYQEAIDTLTALVAREPVSFTGRTRWLVAEAVRVSYEAQLRWLTSAQRVLAHAAPDATIPVRLPDAYRGARLGPLATPRPAPQRSALRG
jgi:DNA-binding PadR family transcriptional regulator